MTDNFYAPPHSIEAEQAVIGGLLLDDDSSERVQTECTGSKSQ